MKKLVFILILVSQALTLLNGQEKTEKSGGIGIERLSAGDLFFHEDTVSMNVISASRSSKKIEELPITIHVVTRQEILKNHYYTLIDVLRNLPGMRVSQPGSGELGETFQLRGLTGNLYTLILINGLPVKPTAVTGMPILAQLPVRQAERIEVIYGPAAAIYGADAVSGVINIITREAGEGSFVLGDVSVGENYFRNTDFMVGGKAGKNKNILQYTFYGGLNEVEDLNNTKGYSSVYNPLNYLQEKGMTYIIGTKVYQPVDITESLLRSNGISPSLFISRNYPGNYEGSLTQPDIQDMPSGSNLLGFNLKYRGLSISFNSMYRHSHSSLGQSTYLFKYNDPENYWAEKINSATISYNRDWTNRFSTTTNISNLKYTMDNNSSLGVTFLGYTDRVYRFSAGDDLLIEQIFNIKPAGKLEVMAGASLQFSGNLPQTNFLDTPFRTGSYKAFSKTLDMTDSVAGKFGLNPIVFYNTSIFAQVYYSMGSVRIMGGLRADDHSNYGLYINPRLAAQWTISHKSTFRGSVGYAFKAPPSSMAWQSLAYRSGANYDSLTYLVIPNPDLEPEKYMSVELGVSRKLGRKVNLDISVYYNEIRNLIMNRTVYLKDLDLPLAIIRSDSSYVLTKSNNHNAVSRLYGLQATFKFSDLVTRIHLSAEMSLSFSRSSDTFPNLVQIAESYLANFKLLPQHYGQLKISAQPGKRLYLQFSSIWESSWLRVFIPVRTLYDKLLKDKSGFYTMDVVADYLVGNNLHAFVKITNVFNEKYGGLPYSVMNTPLPYNPQSGRFAQFGLTYTFN